MPPRTALKMPRAAGDDLGTKAIPVLVHGHQYSLRDFYAKEFGTLRPTVPYFQCPGEEVWAGAGGVLTSVRDMGP